jgi:hypothetical protein
LHDRREDWFGVFGRVGILLNGDGFVDHGLGNSGGLLWSVNAEGELEFPPQRYAVNFILIPNHVVMDLVRPEGFTNAKCPSLKRKRYHEVSQTGISLAHIGLASCAAIAASPTRGVHRAEDRLRRAQFDGGEFVFLRFFDPVSDGAEDGQSGKKDKERTGEVHLEFEGEARERRHKLFVRGANVF